MDQQKRNIHYIAGVERNKFWLYLLFLLASILISAAIIILGFIWNNSLINYFLSLSASLVAAPIFAYLLELIVVKQETNKKKAHKRMLVGPIVSYMNALAFRVQMLSGETASETNNPIEHFGSNYNKVFSEYCELLSSIKNNRNDLVIINRAFNIKNGVEEYSIKPMKNSLRALFENDFIIKDESLLNDLQLYHLHFLDETLDKLKLPFLDSLGNDHNHSTTTIDWPDGDVSKITKDNYISSIKVFITIANDLANELDEFSAWKRKH